MIRAGGEYQEKFNRMFRDDCLEDVDGIMTVVKRRSMVVDLGAGIKCNVVIVPHDDEPETVDRACTNVMHHKAWDSAERKNIIGWQEHWLSDEADDEQKDKQRKKMRPVRMQQKTGGAP